MSLVPGQVERAVCYLRKSREDEEAEVRGEDTLAKQRAMLVEDVLSRYSFDYDLAEEVASGDSIAARPVFRSLLPKLGTTYQAIVCKDLSRLGRGSYGDMGIVYDVVRQHRVLIITKDAVYDPNNFSDLRMIRFALFFNREEYEMTLWRLTEGKYDGAMRGKWVAGPVPFGYRYSSETQVLHPSEEAYVVQLIYRWYVEDGIGYRGIALRLSERGVPSPRARGAWHPEVVRRILKNPAYVGTLSYRKTRRDKLTGRVLHRPAHDHIVVERAFDAIVHPDTWRQAQRRMHHSAASLASSPTKTRSLPWELAGVVVCADCRRPLIRQASRQRYRKVDGTVSTYQKEFLYCSSCHYAVKYRDCEAQLLEVLKGIEIDSRRLRRALADDEEVLRRRRTGMVDGSVPNVAAQRRRMENRLRRARSLLLDGTLTKDEYLAVRDACQLALQALSTELPGSACNRRPGSGRPDADAVLDVAHESEMSIGLRTSETMYDLYIALALRQFRNKLLRLVFDTVALRPTLKGQGRNRPTRFDLYASTRCVNVR